MTEIWANDTESMLTCGTISQTLTQTQVIWKGHWLIKILMLSYNYPTLYTPNLTDDGLSCPKHVLEDCSLFSLKF